MVTRQDLTNEPYCSNCGYVLTGLTESARCPECGKPIVEVLTRNTQFRGGKRWRSRAKLFGWPVIDIALGPRGGQLRGVARGIIAIGDIAIGGVAVGGMSFGVVCVGGLSMGLCSLGGVAVGLLSALGGCAVGSIAMGGLAIGGIAIGGQAFGVAAIGGKAMGLHTWSVRGYSSPEARQFFERFLHVGQNPRSWFMIAPIIQGVLHLAVAALIAAAALFRCARDGWRNDEPA